MGGAEAHECWDEVPSMIVRYACRQSGCIFRRGDDAQRIAQPFDRRTRDEDRAFKRIGSFIAGTVCG